MKCEGCGEHSFLLPLHGDKGGPLRCPLCVGKWNAEHGRKRRTGRIAIRALMAFQDAGGSIEDIKKLTDSAMFGTAGLAAELGFPEITDQLGYMDGIARMDGADVDLTSELLADVLVLTHPDHHPPERQQLAHRVTQGLLALKPFVFSAPKPNLEPGPKPSPRSRPTPESKPSRPRYPCADCADATPDFYCDACRAEWEKRRQEEFEQRKAKQRAQYKRYRQEKLARRSPQRCESCGTEFKRTRTDARYCSNACRQRAHRAVTDKSSEVRSTTSIRNGAWERGILALLERHPAVFLNDLLPEERTRAQYQALALTAVKLEEEGKIDSRSYWVRWGRPGHKVLVRRGYQLDEKHKEYRLTAKEKLR
jgi:hypothetical protein